MRIAPEDHTACCGEHFPRKLVNDRLVRRHIDSTIFFCSRKTKQVIVFVDGTANRTKRIVAVRQDIGDGKPLQSGGPRRLNNADVGNIMTGQLIKSNMKGIRLLPLLKPHTVTGQNSVGDGSLFGFFFPLTCRKGIIASPCISHLCEFRLAFRIVLDDFGPV